MKLVTKTLGYNEDFFQTPVVAFYFHDESSQCSTILTFEILVLPSTTFFYQRIGLGINVSNLNHIRSNMWNWLQRPLDTTKLFPRAFLIGENLCLEVEKLWWLNIEKVSSENLIPIQIGLVRRKWRSFRSFSFVGPWQSSSSRGRYKFQGKLRETTDFWGGC